MNVAEEEEAANRKSQSVEEVLDSLRGDIEALEAMEERRCIL